MTQPRRIAVTGGGVIGLTTAVNIMESISHVHVTVVADRLSPHTTSDVAAGLWLPHALSDTPVHLQRRWGRATFDHLQALAQSPSAAEAGVQWVSGHLISRSDQPRLDPLWKDMVHGFRMTSQEELAAYPGHVFGYSMTTLLSEPSLYLAWLMKRFRSLGGRVVQRKIKSVAELSGEGYHVVVNCTGAGANELVADATVKPIRGQLIKVAAPWIKHFVVQLDGPSHVVPGVHCVSIGGVHEDGSWNTDVNDEQKDDIWRRATELVPSLKRARVLYHCAGLRPARTVVRLEREDIQTADGSLKVVHNYGHGGAGFTIGWGCAQDATALARECLTHASPKL